MHPLKDQSSYIFVIDTDHYAGNFERLMVAFMTGHLGECNVGSKEAVFYYKELGTEVTEEDLRSHLSWEDLRNPLDFVEQRPDDHGCMRPATICPTPGTAVNENTPNGEYNSVGFFCHRRPTLDQIKFLVQRAFEFVDYAAKSDGVLKYVKHPINIIGFRLVTETTKYSFCNIENEK